MTSKNIIVFNYCLFEAFPVVPFDLWSFPLEHVEEFLSWLCVFGWIKLFALDEFTDFLQYATLYGVCSVSFPGISGVGNQKLSSLGSCSLDFMSSLTYIWVSSGSFNSDSAAVSIGRICVVSSGLSIRSSAILVWLFMVYGNLVRLTIMMLMRLLWAEASAGATMMFVVSSNCGDGCIAPVISFLLVVTTIAFTVVVCCGGIVWFKSVMICRGLGLHFFSFRLSLLASFRRVRNWWSRWPHQSPPDGFSWSSVLLLGMTFSLVWRMYPWRCMSQCWTGCQPWLLVVLIVRLHIRFWKEVEGIPLWRNYHYSF